MSQTGRAIGQAVSIRTNVDEAQSEEKKVNEERWASDWAGKPEFVDQMVKGEPGLHWRYAGTEAVVVDLLDEEGLKKWNGWLARTYPEGAPEYLVESRPDPYIVGPKLVQYALFRRIEYRRMLRSKPLNDQRSINDPD